MATSEAAAIRPRISIVTISFNQARFLETAIRSVLDQDYPAVEHIVVDPGSTDGSRAIIARHAPRLGAVVLDRDDGPADGLNRGFARATGDIFGYVNADDALLPGALTRVAAHFAANPAADVLCGNGELIDADGRMLRTIRTSTFSLRAMGHGALTFVQQGNFFRRAAFDRAGGFNVRNRTCWDYELLADMALAGARVVNVPDRLGQFRLYGETITGSGRLVEQIKADERRVAAKALGRPLEPGDRLLRPVHRLIRHATHPRGAVEGLVARLRGRSI